MKKAASDMNKIITKFWYIDGYTLVPEMVITVFDKNDDYVWFSCAMSTCIMASKEDFEKNTL